MATEPPVTSERIVELILATKPQSGTVTVLPTDDLWERRLLDSFAVVNFVFKLEETFGITIDFSDVNARNFNSVNSILDMLARKYGVGARP